MHAISHAQVRQPVTVLDMPHLTYSPIQAPKMGAPSVLWHWHGTDLLGSFVMEMEMETLFLSLYFLTDESVRQEIGRKTTFLPRPAGTEPIRIEAHVTLVRSGWFIAQSATKFMRQTRSFSKRMQGSK